MKIEVSNGEIVDKYTIVNIKLKKCSTHTEKHTNLLNEYSVLKEAVETLNIDQKLLETLQQINETLWEIEDKIRILEEKKQFDKEFVELARSVYITNDKRFLIKKKINVLSNSQITEEKILPNIE
jgi:hypothetical protein